MAKETKKRDKFSPLTVVMLIVLIIYCIALVFILYYGLLKSLKPYDKNGYNPKTFWKFQSMTFRNYIDIFKVANNKEWLKTAAPKWSNRPALFDLFLNTVFYSLGGAFLNVVVTCLVSYLAARYHYFFSKIIYMIVIVVMVVPIVGAQASEIQILKNLQLYNTRWAFLVLKASFVGIYFLVFYAAFKDIPMTYTEAAMLDGANDWCIMVKVCLPLVMNVFMTVFLITFIQFWNDYQLALLYMPGYPTLSYFVFNLTSVTHLKISDKVVADNGNLHMAGALFLIIPTTLLFSIFHEKLMGNLSIGGIKG